MVKGITKKMIMVKSPNTDLFEQAFFVIKDDMSNVTPEKIMSEACRVADDYMKQQKHGKSFNVSHIIAALCGCAVTGVIWAICALLL